MITEGLDVPQTLTVVNRFKNLKFKDFRVPWTVFTESVQNDQLALPRPTKAEPSVWEGKSHSVVMLFE